MSRAQVALTVAAAAFAATLACAWFLLPSRVDVVLGETDLTLDRWQYVLGAGLVGWALSAGAGGMGLGIGSLARAFRTGEPEPGDLGTWLEAWVFLPASAYVWVQVAADGSPDLGWWHLGVVLGGVAGGWLVVLLHARLLAGPVRD